MCCCHGKCSTKIQVSKVEDGYEAYRAGLTGKGATVAAAKNDLINQELLARMSKYGK